MPHVSVRLVASDKCDCLLPVSLLRELSLQDFAVFLFTDPVTGRSVIVSWSGGIARDKSCIELPRQYTSLNLVGQSYVNSENPQVFSLEMHRIDNLFHSKEITMEPVNDIDWHTICSHRAFLESNILRQLSVVYCSQMVCVRVTSSQSVNLRVISISSGNNLLNADDVSDGEATGSSGDMPELAGNLASGQLNDSDGTSLWSKVYEIMHSAYSSAKELISEDKESLTSVVLSTATSVGKLSSQSVVSIRPPCGRPTTSSSQDALDVNSTAPNRNHGAASEEMWQSELYRERICDSSSKQLLRVLPVWSRGKDSSYFGTDIVRKQLVDENEGVDCTADALSEGMRTLLSESTSEDDEILTAPEDICTCYVHPLYLLECEEMAFTYMVYTHQLEQRSNWNTGFLDKHWECMAIGGEGWCFLGTLQCTTDAMSIADCLQPVGLVGAPPRSDSSTPDIRPLISSVVVRVVPCARVRPGHILVSTDLRRALNLSDMELARLTLLDPLKHPPVRPAAVTVRCVEWNVLGEERNISVDIKSSLDVDSSTVCRRFKDKMISLRDCCRPLGPVFLPAELLITLPSQSHLPNSNLTLLVSFQKTTSGVPESASEVARPHMYTLLDSDSEFIAFVDECCESITLALEGLHEGTEGKASSPHSNWLLTANVLSDTYHRWHTTNATTGSALLPLPSEPVSIPLTEMRGCDEAIDDLLSDTMISFLPQAVFQRIVSPSQMGAIRSPVGSIIVGPPGCGKTTLSRGLCNHFASSLRTLVHVVTVRSDNVHTMKTERVCDMLSAAFDEAYSRAPSIVCIDDLHKICPSTYETSDSPLDPSMRARYEKISDHMTQLIKNTRHNNDFGTSQAERFYAVLAQSPPVCDCVHEEASSKCNLEGQMFHSDLFRSIASEQTSCEMPCKYGICSGGRGLAYAAHRIVASTVYKSVYVVATAPRTDEVNARLLTLLSIGRKIVPLTTTLLVDSQIEILCYALEKLGLPLFLASEAEDKASRRRELSLLGRIMEGYRPGDIWGLARRVVTLAHRRPFTVHQHGREMPTPLPTKNSVSVGEIEHASKMFLATAAKDLEVGTYDRSIMFNMIGGYENAKKILLDTFQRPVMFKKLFANCPVRMSRGVLLYGPPGCGKTMLAQAAGNECGLFFIPVRGPELIDKYIGASEKAVRNLFDRARSMGRPCLIFFDEFEALGARRGQDTTGVTDRVVNQLLTYLDGVENTMGKADGSGGQVYVMAATSRPDMVDPALIRPGRIESHAYVGFPGVEERKFILRAALNDIRLENDVEATIERIATHAKLEHCTGADVHGIATTACIAAARHCKKSSGTNHPQISDVVVTSENLLQALNCMEPSLSAADFYKYSKIYESFRTGKVDTSDPRTALK